ncbi:hypothetical protein OG535_13260 [Kitasatospora sp. NBC_00085]|uniref:hypothetical protein n=1 Tax=Kitasatospora sp. NBC_00085 TaxID=2903566 RepID=UPI0032565B31
MRRSYISRPTENAAINRTRTPLPTAPAVVIARRLAAAENHRDHCGQVLLSCLLKRCVR